ncbi:hypothetical protein CC86DRAFT_402958 [Ophiobolus disseminans]|uniref:Uncharacterized protein n=1 Tax=Ophiobolus disseminans TaxID=1469910 RepID=A0A6A7AA75_9PLEO|nr:hypothetical protein CC86DRAFT_402958 [Ophiobolus disseminans]
MKSTKPFFESLDADDKPMIRISADIKFVHPFLALLHILLESDAASFEATQQWLQSQSSPTTLLNNIHTVAFLEWDLFRTESPRTSHMKQDRNTGTPFRPLYRIGPTPYICATYDSDSLPAPIRFLHTLPNLHHLEICIPLKPVKDRSLIRVRQFYDMYSLTKITSLESVTLFLGTERCLLGKTHTQLMGMDEERRQKPIYKQMIVAYEDAWGMESRPDKWFRRRKTTVNVRVLFGQHAARFRGEVSGCLGRKSARREREEERPASFYTSLYERHES